MLNKLSLKIGCTCVHLNQPKSSKRPWGLRWSIQRSPECGPSGAVAVMGDDGWWEQTQVVSQRHLPIERNQPCWWHKVHLLRPQTVPVTVATQKTTLHSVQVVQTFCTSTVNHSWHTWFIVVVRGSMLDTIRQNQSFKKLIGTLCTWI